MGKNNRKKSSANVCAKRKLPSSSKLFRHFVNTQDLNVVLYKTKIYQDVIGMSREEVSKLFEEAMMFLQKGNFEEAVLAFSFLTKLNPYAADFWIGLGVGQLLQEEYKKAFDAFLMAITMDASRYDCYAYAIECCVEMKNFAQAEALLKQAVTYARRHRNQEESAFILHEASRIESEIEAKKALS